MISLCQFACFFFAKFHLLEHWNFCSVCKKFTQNFESIVFIVCSSALKFLYILFQEKYQADEIKRRMSQPYSRWTSEDFNLARELEIQDNAKVIC